MSSKTDGPVINEESSITDGSSFSHDTKGTEVRPENKPNDFHSWILREADQIVRGERQDDYGDMRVSFDQIAAYWTVYLDRKLVDPPLSFKLTGVDVANLMILLKMSRAQHRQQRDSYVDIAGYVACAEKIGELK